MSVSRPARCLLRHSRPSSSLSIPASRRSMHQTIKRQLPAPPKKGKQVIFPPKTQGVPDAFATARFENDVPLTREAAEKAFPPYTEEEMEFLRRKYTPEQMAAIEAGEAAIDPLDLLTQGVVRTDRMRLRYLDDLRNIHPIMDKKRIAPHTNSDPNLRYKTDDEMDEEVATFWENSMSHDKPEDAELAFEKFVENYRFTVGKEEAERDPPDYLAPSLPKLTDPLIKRVVADEDANEVPEDGGEFWNKLVEQTGLSLSYLRSLRHKRLMVNSVSNQTRMGKIHRPLVMMVVGNEAGLLGIGLGKSTEIPAAAEMALGNAIRNMTPIPRYERRTIYGDVSCKVGATVVNLFNRPPGFGIRCQSRIYEMCKCAGISDISARVPRGRNQMNTIKAAFEALTSQRLPDTVARGRGKKMIDVRKVYYAGMT